MKIIVKNYQFNGGMNVLETVDAIISVPAAANEQNGAEISSRKIFQIKRS